MTARIQAPAWFRAALITVGHATVIFAPREFPRKRRQIWASNMVVMTHLPTTQAAEMALGLMSAPAS
jgi:hypothetical protein